jgi:hypothetical protein
MYHVRPNPGGGENFRHVQTGPGADPAAAQWVPGLFPRGKAAGAWR